MSEWVDLQLSHQLTSVKAPDELWARIETRRRPRRRSVSHLALATAAALLAVIAVAYSSTRPHEARHTASISSTTCNLCHTM